MGTFLAVRVARTVEKPVMVSVAPTGGWRVRAVPPVPVPTGSRARLARTLCVGLARVWRAASVSLLLGGAALVWLVGMWLSPATSAPQLVAQVSTLPSSTHASSVSHLGVLAGPAPGPSEGSGGSSPAPKPAAAPKTAPASDPAPATGPPKQPAPANQAAPATPAPTSAPRKPGEPDQTTPVTAAPKKPGEPAQTALITGAPQKPGEPAQTAAVAAPPKKAGPPDSPGPSSCGSGGSGCPTPPPAAPTPTAPANAGGAGAGGAGHGGGTDGRLDAAGPADRGGPQLTSGVPTRHVLDPNSSPSSARGPPVSRVDQSSSDHPTTGRPTTQLISQTSTDPNQGPSQANPAGRKQVTIDGHGRPLDCACTGSKITLAPDSGVGADTGPRESYTGQNEDIVVTNSGPVRVRGDHNTISAGDGDNRNIQTGGTANQTTLGNGNGNRVTAYGNDNTATVGNGNHNQVVTGAGHNNLAAAGDGDDNHATAGKGDGNIATVGNGNHNQVVTGAGNDNTAQAGNGDHNQVTAGKGSGNSAMVGDGNHNRALTGAGDDNLATAGDGQDSSAIAGGPGNRNVAIAGDGERNHAEVGPGNGNLAAVGAGRDNSTRTGAGNDNATLNGPGVGSRTQVGPGSGNTANEHPVDPKNYRPLTPLDPPAAAAGPNTPGQPQNGNQQNGNRPPPGQPVPPLISPYAKSLESGIQNYLGKYNRYQRTLRDAATRHLIASDQMRNLANSVRDSKVPGAKQLAGGLDRYGNLRAGRAQWYGSQSQRLGEISGQKLNSTTVGEWFKRGVTTVRDPKTGVFVQGRVGRLGISNVGVHGHLPADGKDPMRAGWRKALPTQRLLSATLADRINRSTTTNSRIVESPAVRAAQAADPKFPVTTNIDKVGGMRLLETARRGLTKVAAPVGLLLGGLDVANQIHHGVPVGEAVGKTGSGILVAGAVSAGTTALLGTAAAAALVPGPGWAVAGGIVAGVAASYAWDAVGGSKVGAQVGGWVGDRVADVGTGVKNFFGGLSHAFG